MTTQPAMSTNKSRSEQAAPPGAVTSLAAATTGASVPDRATANADVVKAIYAAFAKNDVPTILSKLRDDVVWEFGYPHNSDIPWLKTGRGHDHVAGFFATLRGFRFDRFEVIDVLASEEWVVGLIALDITWTATGGRIVEACLPHVWRFDESGLVASYRNGADTRQHARALQAK